MSRTRILISYEEGVLRPKKLPHDYARDVPAFRFRSASMSFALACRVWQTFLACPRIGCFPAQIRAKNWLRDRTRSDFLRGAREG